MITIEHPRPKYTVWDNLVPIVATEKGFAAYLTSEIDGPDTYNELCHKLLTAHEDEVVELYVNTPGGIIDSAFMIVNAIKNSKAKVIAKLSGTVASAGTIITLACDDIEVANHTAFMIHNYSGGLKGKGGELKAYQKFSEKALENAFTDLYAGFLTNDEITDVIEDKDMWFGKDEVLERWKNKVQYK